ncbi:MAG: flagellar hook protein FlgE [Desulfobacteraceae bacterium]|nr:flagellar hook protein FlgE [Desulfobacteraceae bacterium]
MIGALYSGISGLKANTSALAVIGDNIANVNTTGFKVTRVSFSNVFNSSLGQSRMQIGRGVTMSGMTSNWEAGVMETSANVTDMAINGEGMFIMRSSDGSSQYYTRAGKFEFDKDGYLVNPDGYQVQGYPIESGSLQPMAAITMPGGLSESSATDSITMELNLDSGASDGDIYETTISVYDSLGDIVELDFTFTRDSSASGWTYAVSSSSGTATLASASGVNTLAFNSDGELVPGSNDPASANHAITVTGLTPAADLALTWNFLDLAGATDGSVTGYSTDSVKIGQTQNGYPSGLLQGIGVDEDGIFTALYSNGTMLNFAQVALADFASYTGLAKQGGNLFVSSLASGQPSITMPNTAGVGAIAPSSLEMSNVDLATEFVELITSQRAFQANSKVITTSDEVLTELINIKR